MHEIGALALADTYCMGPSLASLCSLAETTSEEFSLWKFSGVVPRFSSTKLSFDRRIACQAVDSSQACNCKRESHLWITSGTKISFHFLLSL